MKPEHDDARAPLATESCNLAEIQVEGDDRSILGDGFVENLAVREPLQPLVTQVCRVMPLAAQPVRDADIHAHIDEKPHSRPYAVCTSSSVSHAAY
jgi:hypothetical protein